jgi:trk system potassium uptake protein TrkH
MPGGVAAWREDAWLLGMIDLLVIAGGIGLLTLVNLRFYYPWKRDIRRRGQLTLQTKISLAVAGILLVSGAGATLVLEWNHSFGGTDWTQKVSWAVFHSAMTRTAGFSVTDLNDMHPATLHISMALMFIGGAPGSMAGGIKTTTAALLVLSAWAALRRRPDVNLFRRRLPRWQVNLAVLVTILASMLLLVSITFLFLSEYGQPAAAGEHHWHALIFECVSAFGTVGLSTGITPLLTPFGKIIITMLMFVGRVGPLMLTVYLCRPVMPWHVRYPEETISLG